MRCSRNARAMDLGLRNLNPFMQALTRIQELSIYDPTLRQVRRRIWCWAI